MAGAPRPRRRRPRKVDPEAAPAELAVTVVTAVSSAARFTDAVEAAQWLKQITRDPERRDEAIDAGLALMSRALIAARAASGDPYIHERSAEHTIAVRLGYGTGQEVAECRFSEARELPLDDRRGGRRRRRSDLRPQERVAAVLSGRDKVDACETLIARARVDLEAGSIREAALQLRVGLEALLVELRGALTDPGHDDDMGELTERRGEAGEAANAALRGELDAETAAAVSELVELSERVLRRRRMLRG